jgi:hypothetical protein
VTLGVLVTTGGATTGRTYRGEVEPGAFVADTAWVGAVAGADATCVGGAGGAGGAGTLDATTGVCFFVGAVALAGVWVGAAVACPLPDVRCDETDVVRTRVGPGATDAVPFVRVAAEVCVADAPLDLWLEWPDL